MKYRTLAAALLLGSVMFTSCVDEFSELNSDPSTITKPDIRFLFTKCEASFQPGDYAQWFGGFNDLSTWSQTTVHQEVIQLVQIVRLMKPMVVVMK